MSNVETDLHYDAKERVLTSPSGRSLAEDVSIDEAASRFPGEPIRIFHGHALVEEGGQARTRHASASRVHS